jgi:hypothetical protein
VARVVSEIVFENQSVFLKIRGPRLDFTEGLGLTAKSVGIFLRGFIFSMRKYGRLGPPSMDR